MGLSLSVCYEGYLFVEFLLDFEVLGVLGLELPNVQLFLLDDLEHQPLQLLPGSLGLLYLILQVLQDALLRANLLLQ